MAKQYVIKKIEDCSDYWEVYQMNKYGKILVESHSVSSSNKKEDTRMPDHFELEILQKGEQ